MLNGAVENFGDHAGCHYFRHAFDWFDGDLVALNFGGHQLRQAFFHEGDDHLVETHDGTCSPDRMPSRRILSNSSAGILYSLPTLIDAIWPSRQNLVTVTGANPRAVASSVGVRIGVGVGGFACMAT